MSMCIGLNIYRPFLFRISISKSGVDNTKFTSDFFYETWKDRRLTPSEHDACQHINLKTKTSISA